MNLQRRIVRQAQRRMVSSKAGYEYENEIAKLVYRQTGHRLVPIRAGFSGNGAVPAPDVLIDDGEKIHAIELKKTSQDSQTFTYDPDPNVNDDIDQLLTFADEYPRTIVCHVGVKFPHRQLVMANVWTEGELVLEHIAETCPVDAKVTRADNVSIRKPPTESQATGDEVGWPSAQEGDDIDYLLDHIGYTAGVRAK